MDINLFEHNMQAYKAAVAMMDARGKAAVIHPTGTGKSMIAFQLAADNQSKKICWLAPSSYIYETQLENLRSQSDAKTCDASTKNSKDESEGEISKSSFGKSDTQLFSNITFISYSMLMHNEEMIDDLKPEYIVLDEFHRCGARMWGKSVTKLLNAYPDAKVLGLTATNIRYLDNQRDMALELFDGCIASEMTLAEAIARGILTAPKYVSALYSYSNEIKKLEKRLDDLKKENKRKRSRRTENADALFDVDFNRMITFHKTHGGLVTLFAHPNSHPYDSGLLITDANDSVVSWLAKEDDRPLYYENRVNAGLHVIDPKILDMFKNSDQGNIYTIKDINVDRIGCKDSDGKIIKVDLDRHLLKPLAGSGKMFCYNSPEYVKDMGTPERYSAVINDFRKGIVEGKNLKNKQKAVFLDRDGTINKYVGFLTDINDFELIDGVAEAIREINESGYLAIVVSNQPVVARGEVTFEQLHEIHNKMQTLLGNEGAYIDGLYFCPHHSHKGYIGEVAELKIDCDCRKPKPGMLLKAADDFNIDLTQSFMVGDSENDIKAGNAVGCKSILINLGNDASEGDYENNYGQCDTVESLKEFVENEISKLQNPNS